jgi:protein-disulfide isomerase
MSDGPTSDDPTGDGSKQSAEPAPAPQPTVVVGYPGMVTSPQPMAAASPGMAGLRGQVRTLRYLLVACLVLLVVLVAGLGVVLGSTRAQLDDLGAQVAALGGASAAAAAESPAQPQAQTQPTPSAAGVAQLGPAAELTGVSLPTGSDATGAILIGNPDAANVVEVYIDYQCPFCQRWEATVGRALVDRATQPGSDLLIKQYDLAFLGEKSVELTPAGASARAASAAACVVDSDGIDTFVTFSRSLFETADPTEPPGQFTAEVLVALARKAGASDEAVACIEGEKNVPYVSATTKAGFKRGVGGTPTVVVNGTTIGNAFTDPVVLGLAGTGTTAS